MDSELTAKTNWSIVARNRTVDSREINYFLEILETRISFQFLAARSIAVVLSVTVYTKPKTPPKSELFVGEASNALLYQPYQIERLERDGIQSDVKQRMICKS